MPKKSSYQQKLLDPRWQKKRLKILERDNWRCTSCGDHKSTLHVHHEIYRGNPWDVPNKHLKTLCKSCHSYSHSINNRINNSCYINITGDELLAISDFTTEELNPKKIPAAIQFSYQQLLKHKESTPRWFSEIFCLSHKQWIEYLHTSLHNECLRWGYVLNAEDGVFGLKNK